MEKFITALNEELNKAKSTSELLIIYKEINKELNNSLENAMKRITYISYDDGK